MPSGTILPVKVVDLDTTVSTDNANGVAVLLPSASGAVVGGTSTNPLRTDPTGTTAQPVSVASLPLPTGAATAAKQPALGTAGSASPDVITVQGIASGIAQPVSIADGSDSATGAKADSVASTDTGTFSLIALFKLSLTKLTTISSNIATLAAAVVSSVVTVGVAEKSLTWVTGTVSASGDTTIISAPGSLQNKIVFFQIQNESSTATTVIMKFGTTAKHRVLCQNQGDGVTFIAPAGRAWGVGTTTLLALNLSGANSVGYTVAYFNEA